MKDHIEPGIKFPDFELPDHNGISRKLSFLQGDDPMILMLSRGHFCPKDNQFLQEMVRFSHQCAVGYVSLVTITTEDQIGINEFRQSVNANWPFLFDEEKRIGKELDIIEYTDTKHQPMIPYTFVLEPNLKIFKIYNGYWYWGRPSTAELHLDLRDITSRIRPDYKIDTKAARKQWEEENQEYFWPYGKEMGKVFPRMTWEVGSYE